MIMRLYIFIGAFLGLYNFNNYTMDTIASLEKTLAKLAPESRAIKLDEITCEYAQNSDEVNSLAAWLKSSLGNPNKLSNLNNRRTPLQCAVQHNNLAGVKLLLADPRTIIHTTFFSCTFFADETNQVTHKIIRLLLFLGIEPDKITGRTITADGMFHSNWNDDQALANIMKNHKKIAELLSPEEVEEFKAIKKSRAGLKATFASLRNREIGVRPTKKGIKLPLPNAAQTKASHEQKNAS